MSNIARALNTAVMGLNANQTAIETTGHNIANASNEDYNRQRIRLATARADFIDNRYYVGGGANVIGVERIVDRILEERIHDTQSQYEALAYIRKELSRAESAFMELSDGDISTALDNLFAAFDDLANTPGEMANRTTAVERASGLAQTVATIASEILTARERISDEIEIVVGRMNEILSEIAQLNEQIVYDEKGGIIPGESNDLRDHRDALLRDLSEYVTISTHELKTGAVSVMAGSEYLVYDDIPYYIDIEITGQDGIEIKTPVFKYNGADIPLKGGKLLGMVQARDVYLEGIEDDLDTFARAVIFEFNKIQATGRGLVGLTEVTSEVAISDPDLELNRLPEGDIPFDIATGSFNINVTNGTLDETRTYNINIDVDGLNNNDDNLQDVIDRINALVSVDYPSVSASLSLDYEFKLESADPNFTFYFSDDTSNFLAAMGVNGLFKGNNAYSMRVSETLVDRPEILSASQSTVEGDNSNAIRFTGLRTEPVLLDGTTSIPQYYRSIVSAIGVRTAEFITRTDNQGVLKDALLNERQSYSGVNLDEEATNLIRYQRAYQAVARLLRVVDEMLQTLINAV